MKNGIRLCEFWMNFLWLYLGQKNSSLKNTQQNARFSFFVNNLQEWKKKDWSHSKNIYLISWGYYTRIQTTLSLSVLDTRIEFLHFHFSCVSDLINSLKIQLVESYSTILYYSKITCSNHFPRAFSLQIKKILFHENISISRLEKFATL